MSISINFLKRRWNSLVTIKWYYILGMVGKCWLNSMMKFLFLFHIDIAFYWLALLRETIALVHQKKMRVWRK